MADYLARYLSAGTFRFVIPPGHTSGRIVVETGNLPEYSFSDTRGRFEFMDTGVLITLHERLDARQKGESYFHLHGQTRSTYNGVVNGIPMLENFRNWTTIQGVPADQAAASPPIYEWVFDRPGSPGGWAEQTTPLTPEHLSPKTYGGAEVIEPLKETPFPWMWLIVLGILLAAIALYLRRRAQ